VTSGALAALLKARPTGRGQWQAQCPAHPDRSPSLSIRDGQDGRVLVHCFAGCTLEQILVALKVQKRDLFAGPPPSAEQLAAARAAQIAHEQAARIERKTRHAAIERLKKLEAIVEALGAKLARDPENEALARAFHQACDLLHQAELAVDCLYEQMRRGNAQDRMVA
jgi:hypothetical protein